jgi:hypothetical protein
VPTHKRDPATAVNFASAIAEPTSELELSSVATISAIVTFASSGSNYYIAARAAARRSSAS